MEDSINLWDGGTWILCRESHIAPYFNDSMACMRAVGALGKGAMGRRRRTGRGAWIEPFAEAQRQNSYVKDDLLRFDFLAKKTQQVVP